MLAIEMDVFRRRFRVSGEQDVRNYDITGRRDTGKTIIDDTGKKTITLICACYENGPK